MPDLMWFFSNTGEIFGLPVKKKEGPNTTESIDGRMKNELTVQKKTRVLGNGEKTRREIGAKAFPLAFVTTPEFQEFVEGVRAVCVHVCVCVCVCVCVWRERRLFILCSLQEPRHPILQ